MTRIESKPFFEEGTAVVHRLRRALAEVLATAGAPVDEPQEMSRQLGLDKTLTWRVARLVGEEDAWEAVAHVPRRPSIKLLVEALSRRGVSEAGIDSVWRAMDDFDRFVDVHSGDRETLEIMASVVSKRSTEKRMEVFRRDGYLANSAIWGVRVGVQLAAQFVAPGSVPGKLDCATLCGFAGFRRLRVDVLWEIATRRIWDSERSLQSEHAAGFEYLDPTVAKGDVPVMREFCSNPLPTLRIFERDQNSRSYLLEGNEVGNTASADVFLGWVDRNFADEVEAYPGECGEHGAVISTPAAELVHDLYVHRKLDFKVHPEASVYSQLPGGPQYPSHGPNYALSLPVPQEVHDLGIGLPDGSIGTIGRYREMVSAAVKQIGHELDDFRAFRYKLRHPPVPSLSVMRHTLLRG
ncbi:MAG: hypothetical protein ACOYN0_05775 [Phycisphaerales bacterium]